jgi:hypothetical protein
MDPARAPNLPGKAQPEPNSGQGFQLTATAVLLFLGFGKLVLHLLVIRGYGIYDDEMYFLACGQHLAWGYVDQPPPSAASVASEVAFAAH